MEIFFFDKDKDNIATSVKIGCLEIENVVYKFLIFDLVFLIWTNRDRLLVSCCARIVNQNK
jgi:hypothetical protein